ncbi:hypothetical protein RND81_08G110100 [Saponaria officinalis]|uniref:Aminotransferase-like plant mobile domain-containing protein n=1 Tax=Saponaria officinalis TaxID=3572 RepID=A0AAW1J9H7_SAPOF
MSPLSDVQKEAVQEFGFGGLLHLKLSIVPQSLLPNIICAFRSEKFFEISDSKKFLLSEDDVYDIFGRPTGPRNVDLVHTGLGSQQCAGESLKLAWRSKFNITGSRNPIPLNVVFDKLCSCDDSGDDFKRLFVLYALSSFLVPMSNHALDLRLVSAVQDVSCINQFNWCRFVFQELCLAVREALKGSRYVRGCVLFLVIAYFHRYIYRSDNLTVKEVKREESVGGLGHGELSKVKFPISRQNTSTAGPCFGGVGPSTVPDGSEGVHGRRSIVMDLPDYIHTDEEVNPVVVDRYRSFL